MVIFARGKQISATRQRAERLRRYQNNTKPNKNLFYIDDFGFASGIYNMIITNKSNLRESIKFSIVK
jgi:hypothetical protein